MNGETGRPQAPCRPGRPAFKGRAQGRTLDMLCLAHDGFMKAALRTRLGALLATRLGQNPCGRS